MRKEYDFSNAVIGKYATKRDPISRAWSHPSVLRLAGDRDPMDVIVDSARQLVLDAVDKCALTVPVDPFKLAELRGISVVSRADIPDARTVSGPNGRPIIEYNPSRSRGRVRFSLCHELAHTFFPDCTDEIRNRGHHAATSPAEYELEMLCNLAAAELLLPIGSIQDDLSRSNLSIDTALALRKRYEASVEAVILRLIGLSGSPAAAFAAVRDETRATHTPTYVVEYVKHTAGWDPGIKRGYRLPATSVANEIRAIGETAKATETWSSAERFRVELVGISPYLGRVAPRIAGLLRPGSVRNLGPSVEILRGNALAPRGSGEKIIAHIVNDKTPNWGAGFGRALKERWPEAQRAFRLHFEALRGSRLGQTYASRVETNTLAFQMICQHGYGPSSTVRLKYGALRVCLKQLADIALQNRAAIHMPRIGSGEAGGSWPLVANLISEELCARGIAVTIYDLPNASIKPRSQLDLPYAASF
ncbi:MAG TPA: ImmA/IrrE family metallo-endopeptidase [Candidatus Limnocylindrales bacterium]|nr:ImmA/IrrE family metallo-endopeptidase [Candidatus Limnocylindrales bacterium]